MPPQLSIIIPAYNEAERIGSTLTRIREFLHAEDLTGEILVVNDGSTDGTADLVRDKIAAFGSLVSLQILENRTRRGKGYSVRHGILKSTGNQVLFSDSDLSSPIEEYKKLAALLNSGEAAIAFGSRALKESQIGVHQSWIRENFGRTSNLVVRLVSGLPFKDTQCGFKLFAREAAHAVFRLQTIEGFAFDIEILYIAKKLGIRAVEVPVVWNHVEGSRVRLADVPKSLMDVLRIRYQDLRGMYG